MSLFRRMMREEGEESDEEEDAETNSQRMLGLDREWQHVETLEKSERKQMSNSGSGTAAIAKARSKSGSKKAPASREGSVESFKKSQDEQRIEMPKLPKKSGLRPISGTQQSRPMTG